MMQVKQIPNLSEVITSSTAETALLNKGKVHCPTEGGFIEFVENYFILLRFKRQGETKKLEHLKNPTKIEVIQEKKIID